LSSVFVTAGHRGDLFGVVADSRGELYLSSSLGEPSGPRLRGAEVERLPIDSEWSVFGGRLPVGAVSAEAVDASGARVQCAADNGAWIMVAADTLTWRPQPAVAFRDNDDAFVLPALPASWPRTPVPDTDVPCPLCSAVTWDEVVPLDGSRGTGARRGQEPQPNHTLVCRTCGHEELMGLSLRFRSPPPGAPSKETRERIADARRRWQDECRSSLSAIRFPVFAADGWTARVAGLSNDGDEVTRVVVAHGATERCEEPWLEISTELKKEDSEASALAVNREALARSLGDGRRQPLVTSDAAGTLANHEAERRRYRAAFRAEPYTNPIQVDGVLVPFTCLRHRDHWAASAAMKELRINVSAGGFDINRLQLSAVPHPAQTLVDTSDDASRSET
jgi:hypothetical protein